jgi:hypothetical protein
MTIVRTHIALGISSTDTDTHPEVLLGTIKWDKTVARPNVSTNFFTEWASVFYLCPGNARSAIARPENAPTSSVWGDNYDVKSRRRLSEMNDSYWFEMTNLGSQSITYTLLVRTYCLLP